MILLLIAVVSLLCLYSSFHTACTVHASTAYVSLRIMRFIQCIQKREASSLGTNRRQDLICWQQAGCGHQDGLTGQV